MCIEFVYMNVFIFENDIYYEIFEMKCLFKIGY